MKTTRDDRIEDPQTKPMRGRWTGRVSRREMLHTTLGVTAAMVGAGALLEERTPAALAGSPPIHRHGQDQDDRLADIYRRQLDEVMSWLHNQPNFSVLCVDYGDVLSDPQRVVHELNRFLDGRLDMDAMLRVPDWSLYRQRVDATW